MYSLLLFAALLILNTFQAEGLVHRKALNKKSDRFLQEGVYVGGRSGEGFTLLNIRRNFAKKKGLERVVLDWGDHRGHPLKGRIGFFHVAVDAAMKRVSVDLSQVARSGIDSNDVKKAFRRSPLVHSADLLFDPVSLSTQLILQFHSTVEVEAFYLVSSKQPSRLILDIRSLSHANTKKSS